MRAGVPENFKRGKHLVRVMMVAVDAGKANTGGNGWQGSFCDLSGSCECKVGAGFPGFAQIYLASLVLGSQT